MAFKHQKIWRQNLFMKLTPGCMIHFCFDSGSRVYEHLHRTNLSRATFPFLLRGENWNCFLSSVVGIEQQHFWRLWVMSYAMYRLSHMGKSWSTLIWTWVCWGQTLPKECSTTELAGPGSSCPYSYGLFSVLISIQL